MSKYKKYLNNKDQKNQDFLRNRQDYMRERKKWNEEEDGDEPILNINGMPDED
jgi:hypothetical protein